MSHRPILPAYQPLQEKAYYEIKKMIYDKTLSVGVMYSETKISKELGISRTPLRVAMQRLAQEGYIESIPSKGFRLHEILDDDIKDALIMRGAIESYCASSLCQNMNDEDSLMVIDKLKSICNLQKETLNEHNSTESITNLNNEFHTEIVKSLGNQNTLDIFNLYLYRTHNRMKGCFEYIEQIEKSIEEHSQIIDLLISGSRERVYSFLLSHIKNEMGV
jgi:DNA-binding GntR family transcriptional regulator